VHTSRIELKAPINPLLSQIVISETKKHNKHKLYLNVSIKSLLLLKYGFEEIFIELYIGLKNLNNQD